ncbi:DUF6429 family protein [Robertmurraya sp. P23]
MQIDDLIRDSKRSKSVYLTDKGIEQARLSVFIYKF